jgi:hypothetical protein
MEVELKTAPVDIRFPNTNKARHCSAYVARAVAPLLASRVRSHRVHPLARALARFGPRAARARHELTARRACVVFRGGAQVLQRVPSVRVRERWRHRAVL